MIRVLGRSTTLAVFLLFILNGCGGDKERQAPPPAPPTTAAPGAPTTMAPAAGKTEGEGEAAPLLAWADGSPEEGSAPLTVEFKADIEGGTPPLKYQWSFGDGTPNAAEPNPKHTYEKPGKYRADLSVTDSAGDSDTDYLEIEVQ
jgi:PKD domain-containing protein